MSSNVTDKERKKKIDDVIDYILHHPTDEISLQTLAEVANYSPFHLQKIFKQIVGETPKQFVLKLRLESALHFLFIHPHRSIQEISIDCNYSSPAVFSRAIKKYFGYPPDKLRTLTHKERMKILHSLNPKSAPKRVSISSHSFLPGTGSKVSIHTINIEPVTGIYLIAPFDNPIEIQATFKELYALATANDLICAESRMYGILLPHQRNIYKAFISVKKEQKQLRKFNVTTIQGGKYAAFKIQGNLKQTNKAAHYFYNQWLPDSGYKIATITGFEIFSEHPALSPYLEIEREVYVPIEPVS